MKQVLAYVQAQTLQAWELLIGEVVSANGTDATVSASAADDQRLRVFSSQAPAIVFHLNFARLLAAVRSLFVAFLEGDDCWSESCELE